MGKPKHVYNGVVSPRGSPLSRGKVNLGGVQEAALCLCGDKFSDSLEELAQNPLPGCYLAAKSSSLISEWIPLRTALRGCLFFSRPRPFLPLLHPSPLFVEDENHRREVRFMNCCLSRFARCRGRRGGREAWKLRSLALHKGGTLELGPMISSFVRGIYIYKILSRISMTE